MYVVIVVTTFRLQTIGRSRKVYSLNGGNEKHCLERVSLQLTVTFGTPTESLSRHL